MHHCHIYVLLYIAVESLILFYCLVSHAYCVLTQLTRAFVSAVTNTIKTFMSMKHCYECNHGAEKDWCRGGERDSEREMNTGSEKKKMSKANTWESDSL